MTTLRQQITPADPVAGDHRISGVPVLPAAAQIDAMLVACDTGRPGWRWQLDRVTFLSPLTVRAPIDVETTVTDGGVCTVSSRTGAPGDPEGADQVTHSQAQVTGSPLPVPHYLDLARLRAGCDEELPLAALADWRRTTGIDYGPTYQVIRAAYRGPDRMVALMRAPESPQRSSFVPAPLLDGVFQCLGALDEGAAGACLPWYVGRLVARRRISGTVWALIERTDPDQRGDALVRGRATLCNQQGEVLLELDRIALKSPSSRANPVPPPRPVGWSAPSAAAPTAVRRAGSIRTPMWRAVQPTPEPPPADGTTLVVSRDPVDAAGRTVLRLAPDELSTERVADVLGGTAPGEVVYVAARDSRDGARVIDDLHRVFAMLRQLAARPPMPDLTVVTTVAHQVTGQERVEPFQTALWGLVRTLRVEYPRARVRLVDVDDGVPPAGFRHAEPELAWRNGSWYAPSLTAVSAGPDRVPNGGGRFLVIGGMGGIGLHVAEFLARQGCAHLTLVGRTVPDGGEARERLDRLAATCDLAVVRADVRELSEVLRGTPAFDGVFHAAGVLRDGLLRSLSPDRIDEVFAPKIAGVHALDEALPRDARPGFVVLFSSVAAVHGNLGQSSYATANAYLDGYAARRRAEGESWYSLNWGLWAVGMGEGVAAGASARGIPALTAADGIDLLQETLHLSPANYVLSAASIPKDDQMTVVVPASHLWEPLADILRNILHVKDVSPDDNLLDLGLDSMMAVEVTAALAKHGLDVDPMVLFDNPGLDALLRHLDSIPAGGTEPTAGPPASRQPSTPPVAASPAAALLAGTTSPGGTPRTPEPVPSPSVAAPRTQASSVVDWDRFRSVTTGTEPVSGGTAVPTPVPGSPARGGTPSAPRSAPVPPSPARPAPSSAPVARFAPATEAPAYPSGSGTSPSPAPHAPMRASTGDTLRSTGRIPRRTLPGRLHDLPDGSFVDRRIDALSAEDREIIARDDYFYEPVVEDAKGAWIRFDGRWFLNLASYSYLGLIGHDYIDAQAHRAVERYGTGAHGVRLLAGTLQLHRELELTIARFLGTEDAVVFSSGYIANVATVGALVGPDDVIIGDVYNHASILDGYRLSGANVVTYAHNDLADLERALRRTEGAGRLVVTDAVFSMDGDVADLPGIVELCERHDAMLMVDEAHSLGVLGATGRGIIEHFGLDPARVPVKMGTLSKTVPSAGGYVAGSSDLIFALKNNARGWMFSAAATPAQVAAAKAAFEVMTVASHLPDELRARTDRYRQKLHQLGFDTRVSTTPVVPIYCASAEQAQAMARLCQQDGLFVQPIVYPTVPKALPRLRTIVNLSHTDGDLDEAVAILEKAGRQVGLIG